MQKKRKIAITVGITVISFFFILTLFNNVQIAGFSIFESASDGSTINDTYFWEQFPNNNFATATILRVGNISGGTQYNTIIRDINISAINSEDTVVSGKLQIYIEQGIGNSNITLKIYRMTSDWTETQATWNDRQTGTAWTNTGGDYFATELDSINITNQSGIYYNFTITDTARGWVNGTYSNYGIIITAPNTAAGNYTEIASSDSSTANQRPKIIIEHTDNAAPTITNISVNSSLTPPTPAGDRILFTITWTDLESNQAQTFVCNSTNINQAGCTDTTFCNTSMESSGPSTCSYTTLIADNRTTPFYVAVCDANNCSSISQSNFYINHKPVVNITQPDGGETINQTLGNYTISFNVSDSDSDTLTADLYYGSTQNSTANTIVLDLNLTAACTDPDTDTATTNACTYEWNSTNVYGTYYLTINVNDSYTITNDTSESSFNVRSLVDTQAPLLSAQEIDSDIYSGKSVQLYVNVSEPFLHTVWVSINTTPETNLTMTNSTPIRFNATWTAVAVGTYQFKAYANDTVGNLNDSLTPQVFTIRSPNASSQNIQSPSTALPFHVVKVSGELNATEPLENVYAYLNIPSGFTFLSDYPQNTLIGNFTASETKNATWFLSVPITEATYTLNTTYTDSYSNTWNSANTQIQVTSAVGGGYSIDVSGYPEVETSNPYYVEGYFKQSGTYTAPDSMQITIYDSTGSVIVGPNTGMTLESTGIYNYTYSVPAAPNEGLWETLINATKSGTSYYNHEFWKVVGGPFDVRNITIVNSSVSDMNISFIAENTGGANKDLTIAWNLTRTDTGALLDSAGETFAVTANSQITWYIYPTTSYVGQVKITIIGTYSGTEKAGAFKTFSTTSGAEETPEDDSTPSGDDGGGGGGGGTYIPTTPTTEDTKTEIEIDADSEVFLTKNIEKTVFLNIKNTGTSTLTDLNIALEGLSSSIYTIDTKTIDSLQPQETKEIQIRFFITDIIPEQNFNYTVTVNQKTYKKAAKILIFSTLEYFEKEIERLLGRVANIKKQTDDQELLDELSICEKIIDQLIKNNKDQNFIDAIDNIKKADECINNVENKLKTEAETPLMISNTLILIITVILILIIFIIALIILYKIYRKITSLNVMQSIDKIKTPKTGEDTKTDNIKEKTFSEKIESIEKKLKEE